MDCLVRTRIPTKFGQMWLHVYQNNIDSKEHLAIVFGDTIRSKSLFATRQGETEQDRIVRGAYEGTLYPGRTHSGLEAANGSTEKMSPLLQSLHKPIGGTSNGAPAKSEFMSLPRNASHSISSSSVSSGSADSLKMDIDRQQSSLPLVRIHSECYTGETVWSARCDCGEQLDEAARLMSEPSAARSGGVIIYLRQEGRGIGLSEKLKAYNLQDLGNDTVEANILLRHPADARSYGLATAMLMDLGLGRDDEEAEETARSDVDCGNDIQMREGSGIRLLTNNPEKIRAVEGPNREIVVRERVEMVPITMGEEKTHYMKTKAGESTGNLLDCLLIQIYRLRKWAICCKWEGESIFQCPFNKHQS